MSARINIITPDHILAYVEGYLSSTEREDVEVAVRDDDRAARALQAAEAAAAAARRTEISAKQRASAAFTKIAGDD